MSRRLWVPTVMWFVLVGLGCDDAPVGDPTVGETEGCDLAVISSDYTSSSLSILRDDPVAGPVVCATDVLHSGSARPGLVAALSGDVVVSASVHPAGWATLIDRFPNGVITLFDVDAREVVRQINVSTGFAANPHDVLYASDTLAYVSRNSSNPTPTPQIDDYDEGGDLLVVDPSRGTVLGRIALAGSAETDPRPTRIALVDGVLWVALGNLARDFGSASGGELAGVDPGSNSVIARVPLAPLTNCGSIVVRGRGDLVVGCSGLLLPSAGDQRDASGLAVVDVSVDPPVVEVISARNLGHGQVGFGLDVMADDSVVYTVLGRLEPATDDGLYVLDVNTRVTQRGASAGPFELGAVLAIGERVLFADADPEAAQLGLYVPATDTVGRFPLGDAARLPPRELQRFR